MFNASSLSSKNNEQIILRPTPKRFQCTLCEEMVGSTTKAVVAASPTVHAKTTAVVGATTNTKPCEVRTKLLLGPNMYIMHINSITNPTSESSNTVDVIHKNLLRQLKVSKNTVLLNDKEPRWYKQEGENLILITPKIQQHDISLLFTTAINEIVYNYNYFAVAQKQLDQFWLKSLLEHILYYFKTSWFEFTFSQRLILSQIVQNNSYFTVFDQLKWIGYDGIIRCNFNKYEKVFEYNNLLKDITGRSSFKTIEDLAVDFALNFSYAQDVVDACDLHCQVSLRRRMPYTKFYNEEEI